MSSLLHPWSWLLAIVTLNSALASPLSPPIQITPNVAVEGRIEREGESREFSATLTEPQALALSAESYDFDIRIELDRATPEPVATDNDSGAGYNAWLQLQNVSAGDYRIRVSSVSGTGTFTLTWHSPAPRPMKPETLKRRTLEYFEHAATRAAARGDDAGFVRHTLLHGKHLNDDAQYARALQVLAAAQGVADENTILDLVLEQARAQLSLGDSTTASEQLTRVLQQATEQQRAILIGRAESGLGNLALRTDKIEVARQHYLRALEQFAKESSTEDSVMTRLNLGLVQLRLGDAPGALRTFEQSLKQAQQDGFERGTARAHGRLGSAHLSLANLEQAETHSSAHLELSRKLGDRRGEVSALGNLAIIALRASKLDLARERFQQVRDQFHEMGVKSGEAQALGYLGTTQIAMGDHLGAAATLRQQLLLTRELNHRSGEAEALGNLVRALRYLGENHTALEHQQRRLQLLRESGQSAGIVLSQLELAELLNELDRPTEARPYIAEAVTTYQRAGQRDREAYARGRWGHIELQAGDLAAAHLHYERQLEISQSLNDDLSAASATLSLAEVAQRRQQNELGLQLVASAIQAFESARDETSLLECLYIQATLALQQGNIPLAIDAHDRCVGLLQRFPEHIKLQRLRARPYAPLYRRWGQLAQDIAARAWNLETNSSGSAPANPDVGPAQRRQWCIDQALHWNQLLSLQIDKSRVHERDPEASVLRRKWREALAARQGLLQQHGAQRRQLSATDLNQLRNELDAATTEVERLLREYQTSYAHDARLDIPPRVSVQELTQQLSGNTVHWIFADGREQLYGYLLARDSTRLVPFGAVAEIRSKVESYHALLSRPSPTLAEVSVQSRELSSLLFAANDLPLTGVQELRLTLSPSLLLLSFATLYDPQELSKEEEPAPTQWSQVPFLIDRITPARVPFPAWRMRETATGSGQLLVADPTYHPFRNLPDARWIRDSIIDSLASADGNLPPEVQEIVDSPTVSLKSDSLTLFLGIDASNNLLATPVTEFESVTIGLHTLFDPRSFDTGWVMEAADAKEGDALLLLRPESLLRLPLRCRRLTLCSTLGVAPQLPLEIVVGPLLQAGAKSLVAPLWQLTGSAADRGFLAAVLSHPDLRRAQVDWRHASPHVWGGFLTYRGETLGE